MTHMLITVDGKTLLDGDLGQFQHRPPAALREYVKPSGKKQPWVPALMAAIMDATITSTPTKVTVQTHTTGWTVAVDTV